MLRLPPAARKLCPVISNKKETSGLGVSRGGEMLNNCHRAFQRTAFAVFAAILLFGLAGTASAQSCGPMDVVFVVDNTGSMGGVISEIQNQVTLIADAVAAASNRSDEGRVG